MAAHPQPHVLASENEPQEQQETFTIQEAADVLNVNRTYSRAATGYAQTACAG